MSKTKFQSIFEQVAAGVIVLIIGGASGWMANQTFYPNLPVVTAVIENASNNDKLKYKTRITGRYSGELGENSELWVITSHLGEPDRYHPYRVSLGANSNWSSEVYLGESETSDINENFSIAVIILSKDEAMKFDSYLTRSDDFAKNNPSYVYEGIKRLPRASRKLDIIDVVRM